MAALSASVPFLRLPVEPCIEICCLPLIRRRGNLSIPIRMVSDLGYPRRRQTKISSELFSSSLFALNLMGRYETALTTLRSFLATHPGLVTLKFVIGSALLREYRIVDNFVRILKSNRCATNLTVRAFGHYDRGEKEGISNSCNRLSGRMPQSKRSTASINRTNENSMNSKSRKNSKSSRLECVEVELIIRKRKKYMNGFLTRPWILANVWERSA